MFGIGASTGAVACADLLVSDDNVVEEDQETLTLTMSADDPPVTTTTALTASVSIGESDNDGMSIYLCFYVFLELTLTPNTIDTVQMLKISASQNPVWFL